VAELEERLTQEELKAMPSAMPTAYADPLIRTWTALGVRQVVATNNSPRVVRKYLEQRGLDSCFVPLIYGRTRTCTCSSRIRTPSTGHWARWAPRLRPR
jgi:beta-phosphoglucomutase-like phosphatase (HAD superfamily)